MYCSNCGEKIADDSLYCSECGTKLYDDDFYDGQNAYKNTAFNINNTMDNVGANVQKASNIMRNSFKDGKDILKNKLQLTDNDGSNPVYSNIPIIDLFLRMVRPGNRRIFVWIFINLLIYFIFVESVMASDGVSNGQTTALALIVSLLSYGACIAISLSPVGEFILRTMNGCKRIKQREYSERLYPLFNEVYEKALSMDPNINKNIELFISDDPSANAYATGRKTICVTKGLLSLSDEEIKGTLAHEFGHISHRDTDILLVVIVGNLFITIASWVISFFLAVARAASSGDDSGFGTVVVVIITAVFNAIIWIWTKVGMLIVRSSMRKHEFEADKFAFDLGYGEGLESTLNNFVEYEEGAQGLFATLASTHPDTETRISKLQEYNFNFE